jgi:hypothetical protein
MKLAFYSLMSFENGFEFSEFLCLLSQGRSISECESLILTVFDHFGEKSARGCWFSSCLLNLHEKKTIKMLTAVTTSVRLDDVVKVSITSYVDGLTVLSSESL